MILPFDTRRSLVIVPVFLAGPRGADNFEFAVDTGSSRSAVSGLVLQQPGYLPSEASGRHPVHTAGGGLTAGLLRLHRFAAFGRVLTDHPVVWLPLAPTSRIDGLLGLEFFRGLVLKLDFARGRIRLDRPRRWWQFWR
jgi:hypothetical protein